jgi:hypothetical protein
MALKQFPRRPEVINAIQFQGNVAEIKSAVKDPARVELAEKTAKLEVLTNHGWAVVEVGDWVIQKEDGELYPCKNELFRTLANVTVEVPAHLPDHMKRVFLEVKVVDENLALLGKYLGDGAKFSSPEEKRLQQEQFDYMDGYSKSLHQRLALYKQ